MTHITNNTYLVQSIINTLTKKNIDYTCEETDLEWIFKVNSEKHVYDIERTYNMYSKFEGYSRNINGYGDYGFTIKKESNEVKFDSIFDFHGCNVTSYNLEGILFLGKEEVNSKITHHGFVIPEYQRELVWTMEDKTKLIETLLKGFPIGMFIFNRVHENEYADNYVRVIDGQQRLNCIKEYMDNKFTDSYNRYYSEISNIEKRRFKNVICPLVLFDDLSLDKEVKAYIAANDTGVKHTRGEIEKAYEFIKNIGE